MKGKLMLATLAVIWALSLGASFGFVPERNPEPHYQGVIISAEADAILKRSCFDCHSNRAEWPWYSWAPVSSALVAWHVREGRQELNFSVWDQYNDKRKAHKWRETLEEVEKGEMPMRMYLLAHAEAKLSQEDKELLANQVTPFPPEQPGEKREKRKQD